ncbi:MAG TPA: hypothetical protein VI911_04305 [Patescibacteria group bacterium]|nr:hypothetical protein [Patescibacteria group bacterium]
MTTRTITFDADELVASGSTDDDPMSRAAMPKRAKRHPKRMAKTDEERSPAMRRLQNRRRGN